MSHTLFNIALEGALEELKKTDYGMRKEEKVRVLAFADDAVLFSETREELQKSIKIIIRETKCVEL